MSRKTSTSTKTPTRRRLTAAAALAATAAATVTGMIVTAAPASASPVVNKPWKHTVTVETTNVRVFQNNWIRSDVTRTSGYLSQTYSYADGHGGYAIRISPFAENTGGRLVVHNTDNFGDGPQPNTSVYDGSIGLAAELDLTVDGTGAQFPRDYPDRNYNLYNLGPDASTGWHHIKTSTGNGDSIELDYRVTQHATPQ